VTRSPTGVRPGLYRTQSASLRKGRRNPHPTRDDGYTEAWDYHDLPVDSLTDVANVVTGIS
jgi:hypothetical protein